MKDNDLQIFFRKYDRWTEIKKIIKFFLIISMAILLIFFLKNGVYLIEGSNEINNIELPLDYLLRWKLFSWLFLIGMACLIFSAIQLAGTRKNSLKRLSFSLIVTVLFVYLLTIAWLILPLMASAINESEIVVISIASHVPLLLLLALAYLAFQVVDLALFLKYREFFDRKNEQEFAKKRKEKGIFTTKEIDALIIEAISFVSSSGSEPSLTKIKGYLKEIDVSTDTVKLRLKILIDRGIIAKKEVNSEFDNFFTYYLK